MNAGSTADPWHEDAVTVNPYLGTDGITPLIEAATGADKDIFVLVRTSNPSSSELRRLELASGERVYEHVADLVEGWEPAIGARRVFPVSARWRPPIRGRQGVAGRASCRSSWSRLRRAGRYRPRRGRHVRQRRHGRARQFVAWHHQTWRSPANTANPRRETVLLRLWS